MMSYEIKVIFAFVGAVFSSVIIYLNGLSFISYIPYGFVLALLIAVLVFIKPIWAHLKSFNRYTWLILVCYFSGVMAIERGSMGRPIEGILLTLPLISFYLYWSVLYTRFLLTKEKLSRISLFYLDVFLISTGFLIAGLFMMMLDSNNTDLRGWWPLVIALYIFYGLGSSIIYAVIALPITRKYHRRYTVIFSGVLILMLSAGIYLPRYIPVFNGLTLNSFSAVLLMALSAHAMMTFLLWLKQKGWTKSC